MKKYFLLSLLMLLSVMASADAVEIDGICYNLESSGETLIAIVKSGSTKYSGEVVIPKTITYEGDIYDVTIIGEKAFYFCTNLTSVTIPNSVSIIEDEAFEGCSDLSSVSIPNSVKRIGGSAFENCSSLTSVIIPNSVTSIAGGAFYGCSGLTSLTIPNSVLSIGTYAYAGCKNLKTVISEINSPFDINYNTFDSGTYFMADLIVPKGTKSAYQSKTGWGAFKVISDGTIDINPKRTIHVFTAGTLSSYINEEERYRIEELTLTGEINGDDLKLIREMAGCNYFDYEEIGDGGGNYYCRLTSLDLSGVNIIKGGGPYYFVADYYGLDNPRSFSYNDYELPAAAFVNSNLTKIIMPKSTIAIGEYAFYGCNGLTSITIDKGVGSIGNTAFASCVKLVDVYCYAENVPITKSDAFNNSYPEHIILHVPEKSIDAYKAAEPWNQFKEIVAIEESTEDVIKITSAGQTTWCSAYDLDFTDVEGLKAYTAEGYDRETGVIWLMRVKKVPAGEGILLIGDEGEYHVPHKATTCYYGNFMVGTLSAKTINETEGEYTNFYLSNGAYGVGFYKVDGSIEIKANRAYLPLLKNTVSSTRGFIGIDFDDDAEGTTGISEAQQRVGEQDVYYNLQGQRVDNPSKGLYIRNGKKVVIK